MRRKIRFEFGLRAVCLASILAAQAASAQPLELTVDAAGAQLSGSTANTWILKSIDKRMGAAADCEGDGRVFVFAADHTVTEERCVDGHIQRQSQKWAFETLAGDLGLRIGGDVFFVRFTKRTGNNVEMRLRRMASVKSTETTDMILRLSQD